MSRIIFAVSIMLAVAACTARADVGFEFSVDPSRVVGMNIRFNDLYELKPGLGFRLSDNETIFNLAIDNNFYFISGFDLSHYAGFGFAIQIAERDNGGDDTDITLDGHYGLRYDINDVISLFGDLGLAFAIDPWVFRTFRSGVGVTFFISR